MIISKVKLDVPEEILVTWQDILDSVAEIVAIPSALIMRLRDPHIEVYVSSHTKDNPYKPGEKEVFKDSGLYCETVVKTNQKLLVPNALVDEHWKNNPDVKLNMISYLGFPIALPDGSSFGTICILDNKENSYSNAVEKLITSLRNLIQKDLELLYLNQVLGDKNKKITDYLMELQTLRGIVKICSYCKSIQNIHGDWTPIEEYLIRHPEADFSHGMCPDCQKANFPELDEEI